MSTRYDISREELDRARPVTEGVVGPGVHLTNRSDMIPPDLMDVAVRFGSRASRLRTLRNGAGQVSLEMDIAAEILDEVRDAPWDYGVHSSKILPGIRLAVDKCRRNGFGGLAFRFSGDGYAASTVSAILVSILEAMCVMGSEGDLDGLRIWCSPEFPNPDRNELYQGRDVSAFIVDNAKAAWRLADRMLPDMPETVRAQWALHVQSRYFPMALPQGDAARWDPETKTFSQDDPPMKVWGMDFGGMTMRVGNGNAPAPMRLKTLAYMMSADTRCAEYIRENLRAAAERNPFMKEVLAFMEQASMLGLAESLYFPVRPKFSKNLSAPFVPFMDMGLLSRSHNWNEFFRSQYPEIEKAGCNFNRLTPWESATVAMAARNVTPESLPVLSNDGPKVLRSLRGRMLFVTPDTLIKRIACMRCSLDPDGKDKSQAHSLAVIVRDTLAMSRRLSADRRTADQDNRISLVPRSPNGYRNRHDVLTERTHILDVPLIDIPRDSVFRRLRVVLPEEFEWLRDGGRLVRESSEMHHCVRTYGDKINRDGCAVYSVIRDGKRYTTEFNAEVGGGYRIGQIRGRYNNVDDTAKALGRELDAYLATLSGKEGYALRGCNEPVVMTRHRFTPCDDPEVSDVHVVFGRGGRDFRVDMTGEGVLVDGMRAGDGEADELRTLIREHVNPDILENCGLSARVTAGEKDTDPITFDMRGMRTVLPERGGTARMFSLMERVLERGDDRRGKTITRAGLTR